MVVERKHYLFAAAIPTCATILNADCFLFGVPIFIKVISSTVNGIMGHLKINDWQEWRISEVKR